MELHLINLSFLISNTVFIGKVLSPFLLAKTIYPSSPELGHLSSSYPSNSRDLGRMKSGWEEAVVNPENIRYLPSAVINSPALLVITVPTNLDLFYLNNKWIFFHLLFHCIL